MPESLGEAVQFVWASDASLLVSFGERISAETNERVRRLLRLLEAEPIAGLRNVHPAYCSLLIVFDAMRMRHAELQERVTEYLERAETAEVPEPREIEIPVCYGGEFGPDLEEVAALHEMTARQVIEAHCSRSYRVYFLGFVPGFAYLGELPRELVTPRLGAPRKKVAPGSVAIAGHQTGVYPFATPGGWRLLGRTPVRMFQAEREGLSVVSIGDRVRFRPISQERFAELERG